MIFLAHSPTEANPNGQLLKVHLENVSELTAGFCSLFGAEEDGRMCGLYHDIGKYSDAFQRRLSGSLEMVDHSTAGAALLFNKRNIPAAMCVAGHHSGLADIGSRYDLDNGTFMARMKRAKTGEIEDFSAWKREIPDIIQAGSRSYSGLGNYFYIKMLHSALTDADWLDTEAYYQNTEHQPVEPDLAALREKLDAYISPWWESCEEINVRRCRILRAAIEHGQEDAGFFSMTVPTGGGKTVSSMAFALNHALAHGLRRIIYVIPYCSILEQTQGVFEDIFGAENITAHYSGAEYTHAESEPEERMAYSAENWEAPIILTTAVQFFESLYSAKPGKSRKLHNIAKSVIVFDEAQMLPVPFLRPCLAGICNLVENFGCSAVLCTATQPALVPLLKEYLPSAVVRELCPEPEKMFQEFRRVVFINEGLLSDEALRDALRQRRQALCVVNSRKQAQKLYAGLCNEPGTFHLSTMMIPRDRKAVLETVRRRLKAGEDCRVVSTSLIEAGVDVDFPEVYRALSGLDSIIQAGGRCNREGKRDRAESIVHVFQTDTKPPRMLEQNIAAANRTIQMFEAMDDPEAIHDYFDFLFYKLKDKKQLDEKDIVSSAKDMKFAAVSDKFHLIDGAGYTIYIPVGEGAEYTERLRKFGPDRSLLRKLGQYSVDVYRKYFDRLLELGRLEKISDTAGILLDLTLYSDQTGLPFDVTEQDEAIFI